MNRHRLVVAALICLMAAACGRPPEPAQPSQIIRGFAVYGGEVRSFLPCDEDDALWIEDASGSFRDLLREVAPGLKPYEQIFTILEGSRLPAPPDGNGAGYVGALGIKRVLYMAPAEGYRCHSSLLDFVYATYGNEPFWSATVFAGRIVLYVVGADTLTWEHAEEQVIGGGVVYKADGPSGAVEIKILEGPCQDTMSGAYFGYAATVVAGDREFRGCALKGRQSFRPRGDK